MAYAEPTNLTTPQLFATYLNTVTTGWFWTAGLASIFVIILIWLSYRFPKEDAFATACYVCVVISMVMRALGLVADGIVFLFFAMCIIATLLLWTRGKTYY